MISMVKYDKVLTDEVVTLFDNGDALTADGFSFHDELLSRLEEGVYEDSILCYSDLLDTVRQFGQDILTEYRADVYGWLGCNAHQPQAPHESLVNWGRVVDELMPDLEDLLSLGNFACPVWSELVKYESDLLGLYRPLPGFGPAGPVVSLAACLFAPRCAS